MLGRDLTSSRPASLDASVGGFDESRSSPVAPRRAPEAGTACGTLPDVPTVAVSLPSGRRFVAAALLAGVATTGCNDSAPPQTAAPVSARPADTFGFLQPASGTDTPRRDGTIGPTRIQIGTDVYDLPTDLPLDDAVCGYVRTPDNQIIARTCWVQIGIADDGHTVEWVESSFSGPSDHGAAVLVTAQGTVAIADRQQVVLTDGTTITLDPAFTWLCGATPEDDAGLREGRRVLVDIDTSTGSAIRASCGPGEG